MRPTAEQKQAIIKAYTKAINEADEIDGCLLCDIYQVDPVNGTRRFEPGNVYHVLIIHKHVESIGKPETIHAKKIDKLRRTMYG